MLFQSIDWDLRQNHLQVTDILYFQALDQYRRENICFSNDVRDIKIGEPKFGFFSNYTSKQFIL